MVNHTALPHVARSYRLRWTSFTCPLMMLLVFLFGFVDLASAQTGDSNSFVKVSGDIGVFGEANSISGREKRRPDALGRIFLRPTFSLGDALRLRLNINVSTDGSSTRQDINYFDLNPRWSWGELHAGDFSKEFSPLTLGGVRIRGGGVTLYPRAFRLSIISGQTQRAVTSPSANRAYKRNLQGLQIGIGRETGTSFTLNIVSAKDDLSSLADVVVDTSLAGDTASVSDTSAPLSVTPQENLVVSTMANLFLFRDRVVWRTEISGAAITRDQRSSELESSDIPDFLTDIFTPLLSTSADYAYTTSMEFTRNALGLKAGYRYIGPGYVSLGLGSNLSDMKRIDLGARYRLRTGQIRLNYQNQRDNLIGQKAYTTRRQRIMNVVSLRLTRAWSSSMNVTYATMDNQASDTLAMVDNTSILLRNSHTFALGRTSIISGVYLDYTYQGMDEKNQSRADADLTSHGGTVRVTSGAVANTVLSSSINYITSKRGKDGWIDTRTYVLGANWRHPRRRHSVRGQASHSDLPGSSVTRATVQAEYRVSDRVSCQFRQVSSFGRSDENDGDYEEFTGSLRLVYHFGD